MGCLSLFWLWLRAMVMPLILVSCFFNDYFLWLQIHLELFFVIHWWSYSLCLCLPENSVCKNVARSFPIKLLYGKCKRQKVKLFGKFVFCLKAHRNFKFALFIYYIELWQKSFHSWRQIEVFLLKFSGINSKLPPVSYIKVSRVMQESSSYRYSYIHI